MIFLDSVFIISLLNENERYHENAVELLRLWEDIRFQKKAINNIVLSEILNKLKKINYKNQREKIINFLLSIDEIFYVDEEDYINAIALMKEYNYTINYNDCLILLTMEKNNIEYIVSFDSDFDKAKNIKRVYV
jgi:hypothetical protein